MPAQNASNSLSWSQLAMTKPTTSLSCMITRGYAVGVSYASAIE